jgi:hypothetical protein
MSKKKKTHHKTGLVEWLKQYSTSLAKHEALSSNLVLPKKKKKGVTVYFKRT